MKSLSGFATFTSGWRGHTVSLFASLALCFGLFAAAPASVAEPRTATTTSSASTGVQTSSAKLLAKCARKGKYLARYYRGTRVRGKPVSQRCEKKVDNTFPAGTRPKGVRVGPNNFAVTWTRAKRFKGRHEFRARADKAIQIRIDGKKRAGTGKPGRYLKRVRNLRGKHTVQFRYFKKRGSGYAKADFVRLPDRKSPRRPWAVRANARTSKVVLNWKSGDEVDLRAFRVYRNGSPRGFVKRERFVDRKVGKGKRYRYRVQAIDRRGNRSKKSRIAAATPRDNNAPSRPQELDAIRNKKENVKVTWDPNREKDLKNYTVYRKDDGRFQRLKTVRKKATRFIDKNAASDRAYTYRVTARDSSGNESRRSKPATADPVAGDDVPAVPQGLKAEAGDGEVALTWTANTEEDFDHYLVYRDDEQLPDVAPADPEYLDTDVENGTTYVYTVVAVDADGNASDQSGPVDATPQAADDTTPPEVPKGLSATVDGDQIALEWDENTDEDLSGYNVYRDTDEDVDTDEPLNPSLLEESMFSDTEAEPGVEYFYVVTAVDDADNQSDPSSSANAMIPQAEEIHEKYSFTTAADDNVPEGYTKNDGSAWSDDVGLGWVREDSLGTSNHTPLDLTANTRVRPDRQGVSALQQRLIHLHYGDIEPPSDNGTLVPGAFERAVPDGWYEVTVSVGDQPGGAKAGCAAPCYDSVHAVNVEDSAAVAGFQATAGDEYDTATVTVEVTDGRLTVDSLGGNNTKINYLELDSTTEPAEPVFHERFRFADEASDPPAGYLKDFGQAYAERTGDQQGDGLSYGWSALATEQAVSLVGNGRNRLSPPAEAPADTPVLQAGLMHMQLPENASQGVQTPGYWEVAVPDGTYQVAVSAGDAGNAVDSEHWLNIEDQNAVAEFVPTAATHHATATRTVDVDDGRLTITPDSGTNTKINWVTLDSVAGASDRPRVLKTTPANLATGLPPESTSVVADLDLVDEGVAPQSLDGGAVRLIDVASGETVPGEALTSGGADTINFSPSGQLEPNTLYRLEITDAVEDTGGRNFLPYSMVFATGDATGNEGPIEFDQSDSGAAQGGQYTSIVKGPDGKMYAGSITGEIYRFEIAADGTLSNRETITTVQDYSSSGASGDTYQVGKRTVIGLAFSPDSTADDLELWISDNAPYLGTSDVPDSTGRIAKLTGPDLETYTSVLDGLPRSVKDHETNSLAFGPDGALYFNQGANNAMGAPDGAWANREERLLSAAVLRLDTEQLPAELPLDVRTGDAGSYDPFADDAPLTVHARGVRNAYDLVWHSNGHLYVPTNGSAAGGNVPEVPDELPQACATRPDGGYSGPKVDGIDNNPEETDYVFDVKKDQYYGHPNPSRCEYVLNNGNPTGAADPFENSKYPIGTQPDPNYALGDVYDAGTHASANGAIEYRGSAFGGALDGKLLYVRYSSGQDIATFDVAADGTLSNRTFGRTGFTGLNQPLDLTEDVDTGNLYVTELTNNPANTRIVLLKPRGGGGGESARVTERLIFSGPTGSTSREREVEITNTGSENVTVTDTALGGGDGGQFQLVDPHLPIDIPAGESATLSVTFTPTSAGTKSATLALTTNAGTKQVRLRGLAASGLGGGNEPSLQRIMDTLEIPIDVGDPNPADAAMPGDQGMIGDEISAQLFRKANVGEPISIEPIAAYGPQDDDPAINVGWHEAGDADGLHEEFAVSADDAQGLMIDADGSTTEIDPGADTTFGFYSSWPFFDGRTAYTEDALNTWDDALPHHVRVYPLKNPDGSTESDAYVVATEEVPGAPFDSQDIVLIVRNVEPHVPEAADAVLETENLDEVPADDRLAMSKIQTHADAGQRTHETSTVRVSNTGDEPMQITGLNTTGPFEVVDPPDTPLTVPDGETHDVTVRFTATGGNVHSGRLDITSNAGTNPSDTYDLGGFWQSVSEGGQEPGVAELAEVFGYETAIPNNLNGNGYVEAVGDEVLSPYWRAANPDEDVSVRQLAAYHTYPGGATVKWVEKNGTQHNLSGHSNAYAQSILPPRNSGSWPVEFGGTDVFGFMVDGESSDDTKNNQSTDEANGCPGPCGHHVRFFPVEDDEGERVPNSYLMVMDYSGINYDYNDNVYLIENIRPENLTTPRGVSALGGDGEVTLTWSPTGEEGVSYRVWRGTSPDVTAENGTLVSGADALTEPTFIDDTVTNGTTYYYIVRAVIPGDSNSASTPAVAATPNTSDAVTQKVNFQSQPAPVPSGYLKDFGQSFGPRTDAGQGDGQSYGWLGEESGQPLDLSVGGTAGNGRDRDQQADQRLDTLMHMQGNDVPNFNGTAIAGRWEMAVPNGSYAVTVAVGDPSSNSDPEIHTVNVEGTNAVEGFIPSGAAGSDAHHETATVEVLVDDGRLTLDAQGGTNAKVNHIDIAATN